MGVCLSLCVCVCVSSYVSAGICIYVCMSPLSQRSMPVCSPQCACTNEDLDWAASQHLRDAGFSSSPAAKQSGSTHMQRCHFAVPRVRAPADAVGRLLTWNQHFAIDADLQTDAASFNLEGTSKTLPEPRGIHIGRLQMIPNSPGGLLRRKCPAPSSIDFIISTTMLPRRTRGERMSGEVGAGREKKGLAVTYRKTKQGAL